jgi:glycogen synthase
VISSIIALVNASWAVNSRAGLFTGFLRGDDVAKVFKMADLYVMPSVSEPFGIAPLEAMSHDVPVIISNQVGGTLMDPLKSALTSRSKLAAAQ